MDPALIDPVGLAYVNSQLGISLAVAHQRIAALTEENEALRTAISSGSEERGTDGAQG